MARRFRSRSSRRGSAVPSQRSFCHITPPRWPRERADASMQEQKKLRVLIVDDEPLARQRIVDMLSGESGVEVVGEVGDGVEAVEAIRSLKPDVVFLDVQMPGKTGLDVVREIGVDAMPLTIF